MKGKSAVQRSLYFAAPLFTPEERQFNVGLVTLLEQKFRVFLPQRDGLLIPGRSFGRKAYDRAAAQVFSVDIEAIRAAQVIFAVLNGRTIDEGVSFELGFAYAQGTYNVGYLTDSRVLLPTGINPMIAGGLHELVRTEAAFLEWLSDQ